MKHSKITLVIQILFKFTQTFSLKTKIDTLHNSNPVTPLCVWSVAKAACINNVLFPAAKTANISQSKMLFLH